MGGTLIPKQDTLKTYKQLVDELLKETSDEKLVKNLMTSLGIKYTADKTDRLSAVLEFNPRGMANKGLES